MLTLKTVNRELQKTFPDFELVKGDGYFYIWGPNVECWKSTMICVYRINDMPIQRWLEACTTVILTGIEQIKNR